MAVKKALRAADPSGSLARQDLREVPIEKAPCVYYRDEAVTLYHGDCLDVLPQIESVDHVISDPPYARDVYGRMTGAFGAFGPASMGNRARPGLAKMAAGAIGNIDDILGDVAQHVGRILRRWVIVFSDVETAHKWKTALEESGLRYARTGAWVKPDAMPQFSGDRPGVGFEPCTICHASGKTRWNGGGSLAVWTHSRVNGADRERPEHPCPKPLPLMVELVTLFTDQGETILDPFAGSGTTGVAAKLNGRNAILIEREEKYCEVAAKRLAETHPGRLFDKVAKAKPQSLLPDDRIA